MHTADILKRLAALEQKVLGSKSPDRRLPKREVAEREGVSPRTIDRYIADGGFPPPDMVRGRAYWWLSDLEAYDAQRLREAKQTSSRMKAERRARMEAALAVRHPNR
jgi:predicted DNA-binding transcriptional regulator AlpA